MLRVLVVWAAVSAVVCGCGGGDAKPDVDAGGDAGDASLRTQCEVDSECDDGVFCNGAETCDANAAGADPVSGCVTREPVACDDDIACTIDACIEASASCTFTAPDADNDGHKDAACLDENGDTLGDDCDDSDANRFPGNDEVCDVNGVDEDCNPLTFGIQDFDGDGVTADVCCNTDLDGAPHCGGDCDDNNVAINDGQVEFCDGLNNDCDDMTDEDAADVLWFLDDDGDNFGDPDDTGMLSCMPLDGRALLATDCNDAAANVNPGNPEACDGIDNDCDELTDEGLINCVALTNECFQQTDNCHANATCTDLPNGFGCTCNSGFSGDGVLACDDVDECATNNGGCDTGITCINNVGAPPGCGCPVGYMGSTPNCVDIDECAAGTAVACGVGATSCLNGNGSYGCFCDTGFTGTGTTSCVDIDECATNNGGCGNPAAYACQNNVGTVPTCTNIDECAVNTDDCDANATCTDTDGSFDCACNSYYSGDGRSCVDIDECATNNGGCDPLTACLNNIGATNGCGACPAGYVGNASVGCTPTLTALTLSSGVLSPALSSGVTGYGIDVGLVTQTLTLTPTVPNGAVVTINAQAVTSGSPWQSPVLDLGANVVSIVVSHNGRMRQYTFTVTRGAGTQQGLLKAGNAGSADNFGTSVAISGDTLVVGAPYEDGSATGVNGANDESATSAGAAYVFTRSGSTWTQQAYVKASNTGNSDEFGTSVAISGDTLVVGAPGEDGSTTGINGANNNNASNAGAAYVFTRSGSTWTQQAYVKASNPDATDNFGSSVAIAGDTVVVGAPDEDGSATGANGADSNNRAGAGAVYVFTRGGSTWTQQAYVKASNPGTSDNFGTSVAIAGNTLVVGAPDEDSNATGINGSAGNDNASGSGAAYVFTRSGSTWTQQAYVKASNTEASDHFGTSVAIAGDTVVVGAPDEDGNATGINGANNNNANGAGAVYVFTRSGSTWTQQAYVKPSNTGTSDNFGTSVAIAGDTVVVGAPDEDGNATGINGANNDSASGAGAAYVFTRSGSTWTQQAYVKASNPGPSDDFGTSVAISGDTFVIGALNEDSAIGMPNTNTLADSGAAYVFR